MHIGSFLLVNFHFNPVAGKLLVSYQLSNTCQISAVVSYVLTI